LQFNTHQLHRSVIALFIKNMKLALSLFLGAISATATSGITIPCVSKADALAYEEENAKRNGFTFAKQKKVSIDTSTDGTWDSEARTWTMDVTSYGASNLNFGLTNYKLPYNAILTIRCNLKDSSIDCEDVPPIRVIGSKQNSKSKEYWTPILDCDAVIIELKYDTNYIMTTAPIDFILSYINIGFRSIGGGDKVDTKSADCNVDVVCDEPVGWEREIRSAATVTIRGVGTCSGSMINNMDEDRTPYFLTAAHCQIDRWNAPSLVIYWNYENSKCGGSNWRNRGQYQTGAVHLKSANFPGSGVYGDAALVKLKRSPKDSWKVTFAGWDNSPDAYKQSPGVCIHHPGGKAKKISIGNGAMATTGHGDGYLDDVYVSIVWDVGNTKSGSSGSPLFNGAHRIIGQLYGGSAECGVNGHDYYGRFSLSYQVLNFTKWLDPNNVLNGAYGGIDTYDPPYWVVETNKYACLRNASKEKVGTAVYAWQRKGNKHKMKVSVTMKGVKTKDFKVSVDKSNKCHPEWFTNEGERNERFNYKRAKYKYEEKKKFQLKIKEPSDRKTPKKHDGRAIIVSDANNVVVGCGIISDREKCRK